MGDGEEDEAPGDEANGAEREGGGGGEVMLSSSLSDVRACGPEAEYDDLLGPEAEEEGSGFLGGTSGGGASVTKASLKVEASR